jgi:hypothetical protein
LKVSARDAGNANVWGSLLLRINGDTGSNYFRTTLYGSGSSVASNAVTDSYLSVFLGITGNTATASTFGNSSFYATNYSGSAVKSFSIESVTENNGTNAAQNLTAGLWNSTASITTLTLNPGSLTTFPEHSSASLYIIS